jgi:hypothetical protein
LCSFSSSENERRARQDEGNCALTFFFCLLKTLPINQVRQRGRLRHARRGPRQDGPGGDGEGLEEMSESEGGGLEKKCFFSARSVFFSLCVFVFIFCFVLCLSRGHTSQKAAALPKSTQVIIRVSVFGDKRERARKKEKTMCQQKKSKKRHLHIQKVAKFSLFLDSVRFV